MSIQWMLALAALISHRTTQGLVGGLFHGIPAL